MASTIEYGIDSATLYQNLQTGESSSSLGRDEFLTLLTTQLCNQDPLNPMQDIDFTGQLAQLTALEEQIAMTKTMTAMRVDSQLQAATGMIGKYVSGTDVNGDSATGMVVRIAQDSNGVYVELANQQRLDVGGVTNIWNDAANMYTDIIASGNVIGMWVEAGYDSAMQPIRGIVEKIQVEDGQVSLKLYGGQTVAWSQIMELRAPTEDELWYTLPDAVRLKVEQATQMINKGVTGTDSNGKTASGIAAGAELDGSTVYIILYSGERLDIDSIDGTRAPTVDDAAGSLADYWVAGLDGDGSDVGGIVVGADEDDSGVYVVLDSGDKVYFDAIREIRAPSDEEKARLE